MAKYLGKDFSDEQLKSLIDFCKIDKLKKNPSFDILNKSVKHSDIAEFTPFFRKGKIGDWRNHFTEEMSKKIDDMVATKLTYKKPFKFEPTV